MAGEEQIITLMAGLMPEEELVAKMEEAIASYHTDGDLKELGMWCAMILQKINIEMSGGDITKVMQEMDKARKGANLLLKDDAEN